MDKSKIFDIPIDNITKEEAVNMAVSRIEAGIFTIVVTPNAEIIKKCIDDENVKKAITSAHMILPDGDGTLWAAKELGVPLKEKVAGVEFGKNLIKEAAKKGFKLFLLGGKPGVAEKAAENLKKEYPNLAICGFSDGYFGKSGIESDKMIKKINDSKADILYVCLGAPAQEIWVYENREKLSSVKLVACLGGSLDIYAGTVKRAPALFVKLKLEWVWRLLKQPTRIGRMMNIPKFMIYVKKYKKQMKKESRGIANES